MTPGTGVVVRRRLASAGAAAVVAITVSVRAPADVGIAPRQPIRLTGTLTDAESGRPIERAFTVPWGTTQIDIDLTCAGAEHDACADFGARGPDGIRGWSMNRSGHVHIDALSASYGYLPGAVEPGEWHVMLGAAPDRQAGVRSYDVTVRLSERLDHPRPVLRPAAGWFAGDLHVHSGHSDGYHQTLHGRPVPVSVSDLSADAASAGLDFLAITDHNTVSHWVDVDRTQTTSPDVLLLHGREITTARGHFNVIGERRFTDFRLGPERPMKQLLTAVAKDAAFVSINHAWLSSDEWCAGCGWADRDPETIGHVAGIEVLNGSTPTIAGALPGWDLWAAFLNCGHHLVAVGGSDVHDPIDARTGLGRPATVVWASSLSEDALVSGLKSGRVFVRGSAREASSVDLIATVSGATVFMGGTTDAGHLVVTARLIGARGQQYSWIRRGQVVRSASVESDNERSTFALDAVAGDWVSVIVRRRGEPSLISNAVYVR